MVEGEETTRDDVIHEGVVKGKDKRSRHWIVGLAVALLLSLGFLGWSILEDFQQKDDQVEAGASVVSDVRAACRDSDLKKQLEAVVPGACSTADKAAEVIKEGPKGDPGEQGPPPTAAQVLAAVSAYCSGGACTPSGPTQGQVDAAVARYCNGDNCTGPKGDPGEDATGEPGEPGASGATGAQGEPGAQGPGPTTEQIAAAVADYCANGKCTGPAGPSGSPGTDGVDARPFSFTFTVEGGPPLNDDQTYDVVCREGSEECEVTEQESGTEPQPDQP